LRKFFYNTIPETLTLRSKYGIIERRKENMKKFLAIAIMLTIAIDLASINITFASHMATVAWAKEPPTDPTYPPHPGAANEYYWNGYTPKWINFTVKNNGPDPIKEIKIVFKKDSDGNSYFNFTQTRQKTGWYATPDEFGPNKRPTVIYFRTDDSNNYIKAGETARFDLFMTEGPKNECSYNIDVWTVDAGSQAATNYYQLFILIDNHLPTIEIIYPANGTIFKEGDTVWINATASDTEGLHPSGIKRVELWFIYIEKTGTSPLTYIGVMKYDSIKKVYWWKTTGDKLRNEAWHKATAMAYDYAENKKESAPIMFFWFKPKPPLPIKNIDPCFLQNQTVGHVGSNVKIEAPTGFKPNSVVTVYFGTIPVGSNTTDTFGRFTLTFEVPEVPRNASATDPSKTLPYTIKVTDGVITNTTYFTVIPWMWIDSTSKREGFVGDQITVTGKGFAASVDVNIFYRDVGFGTVHPGWALEWSEDAIKFVWSPYLGNLTVGKVKTNAKGTCVLTFNIRESYGGFHPIFGKEVTSGVRSGWMPGVTPPPKPPDPTEPDPKVAAYPQAAFFKVKTKVWTEQTAGLSGQYITIKASGLPLPEYSNKAYDCRTKVTITDKHNWTLAIDFGLNKYWVFEKGFILNNEFDYAWASKLYLPFAYNFSHTDPTSPLWNGTLCWRDAERQYHEGSQFLKVPALAPGNYEISIYQFNMQTHKDENQYKATTSFMVLKDPIYVRVNTGTLYFTGENIAVYAEIDLDGTATDPTAISLQLYREDTSLMSLIAKRVDTGLYTASFTCPSQKGNYFIKVNATKTFEGFALSGFGVSGFIVSPTLDGFNATITAISADIATIKTNMGTITLNLTDIKAEITSVESGIATIQTSLGQIRTDISSLNARLTSVESGVATIQTSLGEVKTDIATIKGEIISLAGDTATIKTDIGIVKITLDDIHARIILVDTNTATIKTDIGTVKTTLDDIHAKIILVDTNTATIKTDIGDIQGKVTYIRDPGMVNIQTGIGDVKVKLDSIKTETGLQPTSLALSLIAALSAIIAAILIFRKLYA
jgi:archaellum component FlaC